MLDPCAESIKRDEGLSLKLYVDSVGKSTIGWGHNLSDRGISMAVAEQILAEDIAEVRAQLAPFPWYQGLDEIRQGAVTNIAFNIGIGDLLHFPSALHYLSIKDYPNAAAAFLDSVWAKQVGDRAQRLARQLTEGTWQ